MELKSFSITTPQSDDEIKSLYKLLNQILYEDFIEYSQEQKEYLLKLFSTESIKKQLLSGNSFIKISKLDDKIIGFIIADNVFAGVGFINWLCVHKEYRKKNIATQLLNSFVEYSKTQKAHLIEVYTFARNKSFYERLNFEIIGIRKKGYFGIENIIMDRTI